MPSTRLKPEEFADKVWQLTEDALSASGRLAETRTITRSAFAVGQVVRLAVGLADGSIEAKPYSTYDMPDYEGEHGRLPRTGGGSGPTTPSPGGPPPPAPQPGYIPPNALEIAFAVRAKYPSPLGDFSAGRLAFLRDLAKALGPEAGLLSKPTGTNNNGFAVDIIMFKSGDHFDVVNGTTTQAQWLYKGKVDPDRWRAP